MSAHAAGGRMMGSGRTSDPASMLGAAVDEALAYVRTADPDAGAELAELRRRRLIRPAVVLVGETKRGKSSLVNALLGVPGLSPVGTAVTTGAYLHFSPGRYAARGYLPGVPEPVEVTDLPAWVSAGGARWVEVTHPAPLLEYLSLVDTPGAGGLDPAHTAIALEAVERATALLFVADAAAPLSRPELAFLTAAGERVDTVVFALTKVDAYPGWRRILDDNRALLRAHAPRFADAPWFPVSARLAELALTMPGPTSAGPGTINAGPGSTSAAPGTINARRDAASAGRHAAGAGPTGMSAGAEGDTAELAVGNRAAAGADQAGWDGAELAEASRIADLQHALVDLAGRGHLLELANVLRAARGELARLDTAAAARVAACEADPAALAAVREERAALAARKRTEARQWALLVGAETQRARVTVVGRLRTAVAELQREFTVRIDATHGAGLAALPDALDAALQAAAVDLSRTLRETYARVAGTVLAEVFGAAELAEMLGRLNATLRHALAAAPPRDGSGENLLIALSAGGVAFMAGRGAVLGASVLGAGGLAVGGLLIPVAGIGLGLAAGGYVLYRRRVQTDRQQARLWLRDVLGEARAALTDEITVRFTDLQYALSVAVDETVERRLRELDARIAEIDAATAQDAAGRARRRAAAQKDRDTVRAVLSRVDDALGRARALAPAAPGDREGT